MRGACKHPLKGAQWAPLASGANSAACKWRIDDDDADDDDAGYADGAEDGDDDADEEDDDDERRLQAAPNEPL